MQQQGPTGVLVQGGTWLRVMHLAPTVDTLVFPWGTVFKAAPTSAQSTQEVGVGVPRNISLQMPKCGGREIVLRVTIIFVCILIPGTAWYPEHPQDL